MNDELKGIVLFIIPHSAFSLELYSLRARMPALKGLLMSRISVTRSAASTSAGGASRPVTRCAGGLLGAHLRELGQHLFGREHLVA